jgi:mono/diheme cytochrome c family protein
MRNKVVYLLFGLISTGIMVQACQNEDQITYARYYVNGKGLYESHCQNCHAADGSGLKNLYPPLTDSLYLKKNKDNLACIIKFGMNQKVFIHGKAYEEKMPGNNQLSDIDVTQLLVYIGNSFGNKLGGYDMQEVSRSLKNCR